MIDDKITTRLDIKIIFGIFAGLLMVGGIWLLVGKYFEALSATSQTVQKNPLQQQVVNQADLANTYGEWSQKIISDFFSQAAESGANLGELAGAAQADLLGLIVPKESKDKHLSEITLLGQIASLAAAGQADSANDKLAELQVLSAQH